MKTISVVMSAYNEPINMIEEAINSILCQTIADELELIVVLDKPDNNELLGYLKSLGDKIILLINEKNLGLPASLNRGIKMATTRIIARMDADDVSAINRLEEEYKYMTKNRYDFVVCDISMIDEFGNEIPATYSLPKSEKEFKKRIKYGDCLVHPTFMFTIDLFEENGGYKTELLAAQDYEFIINSIKNKAKIGFLPQKLLKYRIRDNSISKSKHIRQNFIAFYIRRLYNENLEYDSDFVSDSLNGETELYKEYSRQLNDYIEYGKKLSKVKGIFWKIYSFITKKYVREMIFTGKMEMLISKICK